MMLACISFIIFGFAFFIYSPFIIKVSIAYSVNIWEVSVDVNT
jgi:hypothetical protein